MTPEHIHLALNHVTIIGLACAIVPLLIGVITNNKTTLVSGLALAVVCGWATGSVMGSGEEAYTRYLSGPVQPMLSPGSDYYLELHEERAHTWSKLMYVTAALATATLIGVSVGGRLHKKWKPEYGRYASAVVLAMCVASTAAGVYIAESGGKIRRPDFRSVDDIPAQWRSDAGDRHASGDGAEHDDLNNEDDR